MKFLSGWHIPGYDVLILQSWSAAKNIQDQMSWNGYLNEIIIILTDAEKVDIQ